MSAEDPAAQQVAQTAAVEEAVDTAMQETAAIATEGAPEEEVKVLIPAGEAAVAAEVTAAEPADAAETEAPVTEAAEPSKADPSDPSDPRNMPPHGTEVFVGGIPRTATEDDIRKFAAQQGEVHSVKMSYDPNNPGQHRGYGFVRYTTLEAANAAKERLHETKLEGTEALLRLSSSHSKHRLYIGNIPKAWSKEQITQELSQACKGLETVELVPHKETAGQNRGYGFLTFYNHECASAAKDALSRSGYKMVGRTLTVNYAEPKAGEQDQNVNLKSRAVYVGGLPPGATDEKIKELFGKYGEVLKVVIPPATEKRPEQRFCFVHFTAQTSADDAVTAADSGEKPVYDDRTLEVKAAKPQENRLESRQQYDMSGGFGRGSRGGRYGRGSPMGRGGYNDQGYGYDQGYGGYDQGYSGNDQGYGAFDQGYGGYDQYGGYAAQAGQAGMTMVPMMLPSGQVGYVLQNEGHQSGEYGSYGGPNRAYGSGRGLGRSQQRYRPY